MNPNDVPAVPGIYSITNTRNGKRYIGRSEDMRYRGRKHRSELRGGKHGNSYLQNAWNKYGAEAFKFEALEFVENDTAKLIAAEDHHFVLHDPFPPNGYNINTDAKKGGAGSMAEIMADPVLYAEFCAKGAAAAIATQAAIAANPERYAARSAKMAAAATAGNAAIAADPERYAARSAKMAAGNAAMKADPIRYAEFCAKSAAAKIGANNPVAKPVDVLLNGTLHKCPTVVEAAMLLGISSVTVRHTLQGRNRKWGDTIFHAGTYELFQ